MPGTDSFILFVIKKDLRVFGGHNEENVLAAIAACFFAGVTIENMRRVLLDFTGVEHRLEYVMTVNGVPYYNDSKATNPDSTIKALEAFDGHIICWQADMINDIFGTDDEISAGQGRCADFIG